MTVNRIRNIEINNRDLFTGIYGLSATNEPYIEGNLCRYHLWQELYRYLHEESYVVIFYNQKDNFFSYQLRDLELFLGKIQDELYDENTIPQSSEIISIRHPRCRGPLGVVSSRPRSTPITRTQSSTDTNGSLIPYPDIIRGGSKEVGQFYRTKRTENRIFDMIFNFVDNNRNHRLAVVFTTPGETSVDDTRQVITELLARHNGQSISEMPLRVLALYHAQSASQMLDIIKGDRMLFYDPHFKNIMFPSPDGEQSMTINYRFLFYVDRPLQDEIANMLNRRRIFERVENVFNQPMDSISGKLWRDFPMRDESGKKITEPGSGRVQQVQTMREMLKMPKQHLENTLLKLDTDSGRQRLDNLLGIDTIKQKLDAYIRAFHEYRDGNSKNFIPHIAITGNPGTGKTTVARLIGEILREEGLISIGHFIEAAPKDLIGQYVGQTRVKTAELCHRARGGILFIDEAYGLCREGSNGNGPDYGKEAIEALLTFMLSQENDTVVIFAGYPKEIEYFLKNGNPGLERRVPFKWNIEDYKPEVLFQICMKGLGERKTTEAFRTNLKMLLAYKYAMRSRTWGNAGSAEEIVQKLSTRYIELGGNGPMDVDCFPEEYMRHIKDISPEEEADIMSDLNALIGLKRVKKSILELVNLVTTERYLSRINNTASYGSKNMNYIFSGNPGTGKTMIAKKLGNILYKFGILDSPEVIEADVAQINRGDPAKNMMDFLDKAIGKVLFIDEAYSLIDHGEIRSINALTDALTKDEYKGKMVVVLAGYSSDMNRLLEANRGLSSRFLNQIHFDDYTSEELWQVLKFHASIQKPRPVVVHEDCHPYAVDYFNRLPRENFANAREAENLMSNLYKHMGYRIKQHNLRDCTIMPEDFDSYEKIDPALVKIDGTDTRTPMEKLDGLNGIDNIKKQLQKYIRDFHYYKDHPQSARFRPHMAFIGNPGTGKTTVARIFGKILQEEHLLSNGNFIEVKKEDLTKGHIGGTAEQTKAICKQARGGIMFIDEAHQLYEGREEFGYGKEALKVILTELKSRNDTLYIFAGYTREMNEFLDKADPGLRSQVTNIFEFEDYKPDTLLAILHSKLVGVDTTSDFDRMLSLMIESIYKQRNPFTFGNARDMEVIAGEILSEYRNLHNNQGLLDADCLPAKYLRSLKEITPDEERDLMSELNGLVGLNNVKRTLNKLTTNVKGLRRKVQRGLVEDIPLQDMTFLFMGNPGTGKTTVASLLGKILCGYGLLSNDEVNIYTKDKIISKFVGETQKNVTEMFNTSYGRVLFIDEAYMLAKDEHGKEALDQITANMTNPAYRGKMAIVMAGYTKDTIDMLNANSGLSSRFAHNVMFDDYTNDELWQILVSNINKQHLFIDKEECKPYADAFFDVERRIGANFGNVRTCNNLLADIISRQNCRTASCSDSLSDKDIMTIIAEDFPNYLELSKTKQNDTTQPMIHGESSNLCSQMDIFIDCSLNDASKLAKDVKDLDYAVGLIHCSMGEGTGFIVSIRQRYILTCSHVVENDNNFEFKMFAGKFVTQAHVLWSNYEQDMALLEVDELPAEARFLELDCVLEQVPQKLTKLILCGYPDGSAFASDVSLVEGSINNYEKRHQWNDRCFDTIYANVSATHGCSGGPVVRAEDLKVVGLLQGGKEGGEIQFITDIHQLFRNIRIKS